MTDGLVHSYWVRQEAKGSLVSHVITLPMLGLLDVY
jgi:hypothetical protein